MLFSILEGLNFIYVHFTKNFQRFIQIDLRQRWKAERPCLIESHWSLIGALRIKRGKHGIQGISERTDEIGEPLAVGRKGIK